MYNENFRFNYPSYMVSYVKNSTYILFTKVNEIVQNSAVNMAVVLLLKTAKGGMMVHLLSLNL